jgi:two-component system KDP operon response regulator KdpE
VTRILVVDDEPQIVRALGTMLRTAGYDVATAATAAEALTQAAATRPDALIVDLALPDGSGTEVVRELRSGSDAAVIVLSAIDEQPEKVAALDAGADDYITKPFGIEELLARIRAVTRRAATDDPAPAFDFGNYQIDLDARRVSAAPDGSGRADVRLTPTEWRLLDALVRHPGKLVARQQLITEVWGPVGSEDSSSLRFYLNRLRRKLEPDPSRPRHLLTEPGMGYRFQP